MEELYFSIVCVLAEHRNTLSCSEAKMLPGPIIVHGSLTTVGSYAMSLFVLRIISRLVQVAKLVISLHKASCWIFILVAVGVCTGHPGILSEFFFQPLPYRRQLLRVARAPTWDCASDILPEFGLLFPVSFAPASVAPELMQNPQAPQAAPCAMRSATAAKNNYTMHSSSIIPDSPLH